MRRWECIDCSGYIVHVGCDRLLSGSCIIVCFVEVIHRGIGVVTAVFFVHLSGVKVGVGVAGFMFFFMVERLRVLFRHVYAVLVRESESSSD